MKNILIASLICLGCLAFHVTSIAQTPKIDPDANKEAKTISGGVLNGKAIDLPKAVYPPDAATNGVSGSVSVKVLIDENGNVVTAEAVSGSEDIPLRRAAEAAALQAKFTPTLLEGRPAKVSGTITYNFILDKSSIEDKVGLMSVAAFLTLVREMGADLDKLDQLMEEKDSFEITLDEFPTYAKVATLRGLKDRSRDKRLEDIDAVLFSIKSEASTSEKWQFGAGESLGKLFAMFSELMVAGGEPDISKLDETRIRANLANLRKATLGTPDSFPKDLRVKLERLAELSDSKEPIIPGQFEELFNRIDQLISTIMGDSK